MKGITNNINKNEMIDFAISQWEQEIYYKRRF